MGNCLKSNRSDNQSLLTENNSLEQVEGDLPPSYHADTNGANVNVVHHHHHHGADNSALTNLSEEQQVRLAQRLGLIQHLPCGTYDGSKKKRECVICMIDFMVGDAIRFLPCMHIYHTSCIDDWLLRSFTCPSCMEPVDAALISTFYTTE